MVIRCQGLPLLDISGGSIFPVISLPKLNMSASYRMAGKTCLGNHFNIYRKSWKPKYASPAIKMQAKAMAEILRHSGVPKISVIKNFTNVFDKAASKMVLSASADLSFPFASFAIDNVM